MPDEALAVHESDVDGVRLLEVFGELDLVTGGGLAVAVLPRGAVARLFEVTGIHESLPTYDTQREALASVSSHLAT
jgi:hypothetical protein